MGGPGWFGPPTGCRHCLADPRLESLDKCSSFRLLDLSGDGPTLIQDHGIGQEVVHLLRIGLNVIQFIPIPNPVVVRTTSGAKRSGT